MTEYDFTHVVRDWKDRFPLPQSLDSQEFFDWVQSLDEISFQAIEKELADFFLKEMGISEETILKTRTDDHPEKLFRGFKMSPQAKEQLLELAQRLLRDDSSI